MSLLGRFPQLPNEQRRSDLARVDDMTIKTTRVTGFELITIPAANIAGAASAGEVTVDVKFPVTFIEKPSMSFGGELDVNEFVETLHFPTVSAVVISWNKANEDRVGGGLGAPGWFVGASLAVVASGKNAGFRMWVHWQAEGKAIRDPAMRHGADTDTAI